MSLGNGAGGFQLGTGNPTELNMFVQGAPAIIAAPSTLAYTDLQKGIVQYTGAVGNVQFPTAVECNKAVSNANANNSFDISVINTGSGVATFTVNTGVSVVGAMAVANGKSATFRFRKIAPASAGVSNTWTVYALSI